MCVCMYVYFYLYNGVLQYSLFCLDLLQKLDEAAVQKVFTKSLENYIKWCSYLCVQPVWSKYEFKILFISFVAGELLNFYFTTGND